MNINRLRDDLLRKQKYTRFARPVKRHTTATTVNATFYLDKLKGVVSSFLMSLEQMRTLSHEKTGQENRCDYHQCMVSTGMER